MALSLSLAPLSLNLATPPSKAKAPAATDFCYGLPGNIAPAGDWDPANLLDGVSKSEARARPP